MNSFQAWVAASSLRIHEGLLYYLENIRYPAPSLQESMAYAALSGGKRIRSLLTYATGYIFEAALESLDLAAIALELIHSYSLVHDDLPAMDNADWRRGKPSCFKAFGEPLAILAGDALQALAFEVIAVHPAPLRPAKRLAMIQILSRASGPSGMVSGQVLDILNANGQKISEKKLIQLYQLKTGALLEASIHLGLCASSIRKTSDRKALESYAQNISLGFQIQDDLLDLEGEPEKMGKSTGQDAQLQKATYPLLMGREAAREKVEGLFHEAVRALEPLGARADFLRELTEYLKKRDS